MAEMASSNQTFPETPPSVSTCTDAKSSSSPGKQRSPSPDQCCSICLGQFRDKSFTDSCFHTFCFSCLQEWAKVKPVCPLCKSSFNSIIHNIRSNEDYDRIYLPGPNAATDEETRRFRYATTMTHERHFFLEARRMRQFARDARREERRRREEAAISRRQLIYSAGLRVLHMGSNQYSQFRDISPHFFRANPAVTHRLVPWLRRELSVLFNNQEENVTFMTHYILSIITNVDIQSEEFHMNLRPFLHDTTEHFVHEFASFARSPYDMNTYDQMSQYDFSGDIPGRLPPRRPNQSLLASLQQEGNDSDENSVILLSDHESEPMVISDDNASEREVEIIPNTETRAEQQTSTSEHVEEEESSESEDEDQESSESESSDSSEESAKSPDEQVFTVSDDSPTHNPEPPLPFDPDRPGPSGLQSAAAAVPVKEEPPDFHDSEHSDIECIAILDGSRQRTPEVLSSESETERIAIEEAERRWLEERARRKKEREKRKQANAAAQRNNSNSTNSRTATSRRSFSRSPERSHRRRRRSTSISPERIHRRFRRSRSRDSNGRRRRSRSREFFRVRSRSKSETPQPKSWRERFGYISLSPSPTRVSSSTSHKKKRSCSRDRRDYSSSTKVTSHRRRSKSKEKSPHRKRKSRSKSRKSRSRSKERHSHVKSHSKHKKSKKHSRKRSRSRSRSRRR